MTPEVSARLAKFQRRAKTVTSQELLDRIVLSFPQEHHDEIVEAMKDKLPATVAIRAVKPVEIKPADPVAPTLHEDTAIRLNAQQAQIVELKEQLAAATKAVNDMSAQLEAARSQLTEARVKV